MHTHRHFHNHAHKHTQGTCTLSQELVQTHKRRAHAAYIDASARTSVQDLVQPHAHTHLHTHTHATALLAFVRNRLSCITQFLASTLASVQDLVKTRAHTHATALLSFVRYRLSCIAQPFAICSSPKTRATRPSMNTRKWFWPLSSPLQCAHCFDFGSVCVSSCNTQHVVANSGAFQLTLSLTSTPRSIYSSRFVLGAVRLACLSRVCALLRVCPFACVPPCLDCVPPCLDCVPLACPLPRLQRPPYVCPLPRLHI